MRKKTARSGIVLLTLFILLSMLSSAYAETLPMTLPDDAALLELMFPGAPFEALPNFFYTNKPIDPGYYQYNQYGNRDIYQIKETKRVGDQVIVVALMLGSS